MDHPVGEISSPGEPPRQCHNCRLAGCTLFQCIQCNNLMFCEGCWSEWVLHLPGSVGFDNRPHEKSDPAVLQLLRGILEPSRVEGTHEHELELDDDTTWFGVSKDAANLPVLQDYGRFAAIMSSCPPRSEGRYPQLVSFIGQTGAGKSTLVKILIEGTQKSRKFPSPVTASVNVRVPTTGDVHLYADPSTFSESTPILYADCEGLNGGESVPMGLRHRSKAGDEERSHIGSSSTTSNHSGGLDHSLPRRRLRKGRHSSQRDILWATTPETKKREYAVTQLYPRLLYTFSDVVVFVTRNPREFESTVLSKLLHWGAASIDKSVNQPTMPHAIIALNATDNVDDSEWYPNVATERLMKGIEEVIKLEPRFLELANHWRSRGKRITSTLDLLECYYSSVTVVRIPTKGRYMLLNQQVESLHRLVREKCYASLLQKRRIRMLPTAERLQMYLQAAYDHFSRDLSRPFDFIKEALRHNPIPRHFGGNILNLALAIKQHSESQQIRASAAQIFEVMGPMIASCIMLDAARQNFLGTTTQLLDDAYVDFCQDALDEFASKYWPCDHHSAKYGRCVNSRFGHGPKGHQNQLGKLFDSGGETGRYKSNFDPDMFFRCWIRSIRVGLEALQAKLSEPRDTPEIVAASRIHQEQLARFYGKLGNTESFVNHSTCFSCLRELPEHALPCGHVFCLPCVKAYGRPTRTTVELDRCPLLHERDMYYEPWVISIKPPRAGTRVLCLDGGGVRGVATLQILLILERLLEPLQIQDFFDLIVGNSAGGIIALGLGVQNWKLEECEVRFRKFCTDAFAARPLHGIPVLRKLETLHHGSKYKTKPLEELLKSNFDPDRRLFGGSTDFEMSTRVAVTSTTELEQHPVVIANYNRPDGTGLDVTYQFLRSVDATCGFKVWEAARATSAATPFFKPFQKESTREVFIDGAWYNNCPVLVAHHEQRLIWDETSPSLPDILFSVGTGHFPNSVTESPTSPIGASFLRPSHKQTGSTGSAKLVKGKGKHTLHTHMFQTIQSRIENLLNCNKMWDDFLARNSLLGGPRVRRTARHRYIRLNPEFPFEVPKLDDTAKIDDMIESSKLYGMRNGAEIREVAHRLVASTFFFECDNTSVRERSNGQFECYGYILCRFVNATDHVRGFGRLLRQFVRGDFIPFFVIREDGSQDQLKLPLSLATIDEMAARATFHLDRVRITTTRELSSVEILLCLQDKPYPLSKETFLPISGFPRELMTEGKAEGRPRSHSRSSLDNARLRRRRHTNMENRAGYGSTENGAAAPVRDPMAPVTTDNDRRQHATYRGSGLCRTASRENLRELFDSGGYGLGNNPVGLSSSALPEFEVDWTPFGPTSPDDIGDWVKMQERLEARAAAETAAGSSSQSTSAPVELP